MKYDEDQIDDDDDDCDVILMKLIKIVYNDNLVMMIM